VGNPTITVLLVLAAAAGVGFQIPNGANLDGYTAELLNYGVSSGWGDVRARPRKGDRLAEADGVAARVRAVPGVRAVVPVLMLPGALGRGGQFLSLPVAGIDHRPERPPYRLVAGAPLQAGDDEGVLIGASAADKLGARVGDRVSLRVILSQAPRLVLEDEGIGRYEMTVRGIVGGYFGAFDPVYIRRSFLASEVGDPGSASVLFVFGDAPFAAEGLARRLEAAVPGIAARAWMDDAPLLRASIHASLAIGRVSAAMVFFAVAVPVAALLYIAVLGRRRDLALLGALGFSRFDLFVVVMAQGLAVGLAGSVLGSALGMALVALFHHYPVFAWHSFVVRPLLSSELLVRSTALVLASALAAALYPAWRACSVDPAPVLRELG
jgi:ABC-type lipoprotein release transport system permease subunit